MDKLLKPMDFEQFSDLMKQLGLDLLVLHESHGGSAMVGQSLRVLLVDDSQDDAGLVLIT